MSERSQPPHSREAVISAITTFQMLWTDRRPTQVIEIDGISTPVSTPSMREDASSNPMRGQTLEALNAMLSMTGFTLPCRGYLLESAADAYEFGFPYPMVSNLLGLEIPEDNLGYFDPSDFVASHEYERTLLGEVVERVKRLRDPEFKREKVNLVRRWEEAYKGKYSDPSFTEVVAAF